jgi:uncharacterized OB-fold protein
MNNPVPIASPKPEVGPRALDLTGGAVARDGAGRAVLLGACCGVCGTEFFPRHPVCPHCMSEEVAAKEMPRRGKLYAFTTLHVGPPKWNKPMRIGYVDLPNGVRVFAHLSGAEFSFGQEVELATAVVGADVDGTPIATFVFKAPEA